MKTYFCHGKRMYKYPAASTINRLKAKGIIMMLWLNGDFILIQKSLGKKEKEKRG